MAIQLACLISVFLGLVMPASLVFVRASVKHHRKQIIQRLKSSFCKNKGCSFETTPTFEFVRYKYDEDPKPIYCFDFDDQCFVLWFFSIAQFFCVILAFLSVFADWLIYERFFDAGFLPVVTDYLPMTIQGGKPLINWGALKTLHTLIPLVAMTAFFSAFGAGLANLHRELKNFHLEPISFVDFSKHLLRSVVLSLVSVFLSAEILAGLGPLNMVETGAAVLLAFAIGFFPGVVERMIFSGSALRNWKSQNNSIFQKAMSTPVEVRECQEFRVWACG